MSYLINRHISIAVNSFNSWFHFSIFMVRRRGQWKHDKTDYIQGVSKISYSYMAVYIDETGLSIITRLSEHYLRTDILNKSAKWNSVIQERSVKRPQLHSWLILKWRSLGWCLNGIFTFGLVHWLVTVLLLPFSSGWRVVSLG